MKKPKKPIDPTKPLPNPKHEIMARKLAQGSTQVNAYKTAYPNASDLTAKANACQVIAGAGINERALKLLDSVGLSEKKLAQKLNQHVDSESESISLEATKHGLKLIGYGQDSKEQAQAVYNPVQIVINTIRSEAPIPPQPIDIQQVKDSNDDT